MYQPKFLGMIWYVSNMQATGEAHVHTVYMYFTMCAYTGNYYAHVAKTVDNCPNIIKIKHAYTIVVTMTEYLSSPLM